jgi:trimeric autotransporter adhesin
MVDGRTATRGNRVWRPAALLAATLAASTVLAGFPGSDLFVPMAGRQAGVHPSNWYTTLWVHNPGAAAATARVYFLERNAANPAPPSVDVVVGAGDTEKLENVVESYFHLQAFGALRVTCASQKLVVTARVYSLAAGAGERDSVGQDFAGVPASFAIGAGESAQVLGVHQTLPSVGSEVRFNIGLVETTGHSVTARVRAFDENGGLDDEKDVQVREWSQRQFAFKDYFPAVSTENARVEVEVISGTGRVIAYGSGIANGSQDPTTYEMTYPDALLGSTVVQHDATLVGDGSPAAPLGLADAAVGKTALAAAGGAAGQVLGTDGATLRWQDAAGVAGLAAGGVAFGGGGGALSQDAANLYWNDAANRLGIGTATPGQQLTLTGNLALPDSTASVGQIWLGDGIFLHGANDATNAFLGRGAGDLAATGHADTGIGRSSLAGLTSGSNNTAVGAYSLTALTTGSDNTAVGQSALGAVVGGVKNAAFGLRALSEHTGDNGSAFGALALASNTTGGDNAAFGASALFLNTTGGQNSAFGRNALASNTTASYNTALGALALRLNTTGEANSAVGRGALYANTTGDHNTAMGYRALNANTEGEWNAAFGGYALDRNTTAEYGTAVGYQSLARNTTGALNTAVGATALYQNTDGRRNTGLGVNTLYRNVSGSDNTAAGGDALIDVTGGSRNLGLGADAGAGLVTGSDNVYFASPAWDAGESQTIRIGNSNDHKRIFIAGIRGVTTGMPDAIPVMIDQDGQLGTISSSARFKRDIRDIGDGASTALGLRPVTFRYNASPGAVHFGLIAEEVAEVLPELVVAGPDGRPETVAYHELPALLLALVQRQQQRIDELQARLATVEAAAAVAQANPRQR